MTFLDTNVVLRYLTGDQPSKAQRCAALVERAGRDPLYTTALVVAEVVWLLAGRYRYPKARVVEAIRRLLNTPHIVLEEREVVLLAAQWFEQYPLDFIDAYHGALMHARGIGAIYSYDEDFDRLPHLKRLEP